MVEQLGFSGAITPNAVYKDAVRPCKTCPPVVHGQIFGAGRPNTHVNLYRYNQSTHAEFNMPPMTARILPPENLVQYDAISIGKVAHRSIRSGA